MVYKCFLPQTTSKTISMVRLCNTAYQKCLNCMELQWGKKKTWILKIG